MVWAVIVGIFVFVFLGGFLLAGIRLLAEIFRDLFQ